MPPHPVEILKEQCERTFRTQKHIQKLYDMHTIHQAKILMRRYRGWKMELERQQIEAWLNEFARKKIYEWSTEEL